MSLNINKMELEVISESEYYIIANTNVKNLSKLQVNTILLDVFELLLAVQPILFVDGKFVKPNWYNFKKWFQLSILVIDFIVKIIKTAKTN